MWGRSWTPSSRQRSIILWAFLLTLSTSTTRAGLHSAARGCPSITAELPACNNTTLHRERGRGGTLKQLKFHAWMASVNILLQQCCNNTPFVWLNIIYSNTSAHPRLFWLASQEVCFSCIYLFVADCIELSTVLLQYEKLTQFTLGQLFPPLLCNVATFRLKNMLACLLACLISLDLSAWYKRKQSSTCLDPTR